jgi:outer membrane protein OmpA-like peptidoglycan-associated protein
MTRFLCSVERRCASALLPALLAGCATQSGTVVLLPANDGHDSAVTVTQAERRILLDRPYAAARLTSSGPQPYTATAEEVQALFGPALAAQPARPTAFTLHFVEQTDQLTEESKPILESVFAEVARHAVPDVVVVGHTDRVGSDAANDTLARQRAEAVRAALIGRGLAPESVSAVGRGEREPLVPTADGVAEPRNRRVEIVVR